MPVHNLTANDLSIACLLFEHDWNSAFSVSHFFAGDVTEGLSNRETRTPAAEALLLTVGVQIWAEDQEAQALRQALGELGKGWVGMPLLADQFLEADFATPGARIYASQWYLDLTTPAIVAYNATLTAGHTYAPLVVGHITELPAIEPGSGTLALCSLTVTEDSPWEFRIGINAIPPEPGGLRWPDDESEPDRDFLANWVSPPTQQPVRDLNFERIGHLREQTIAGEESALRWTVEASFLLTNRPQIARLLAFFLATRGTWAPFTSGLWFTPGTATIDAPHVTQVRFAERVLKLDFATTGVATTQIKFTEVPWEIGAGTEHETPQQPARVYLYHVTYDVPTPVVWRFTNCWRSLTRTGDGTYLPKPWEHENLEGGLDLQSERVTFNSFVFDGNPLGLFNPDVLEGRLWLRIYEVATDPLDADEAGLVWYGSIAAAPQTGRKYAAEGRWLGGILDREVPNVRYGPRCNTNFGSSRCGVAKEVKTGTLLSSSGNIVVVTIADMAAANTYAPGKIALGGGLTYESRQILASEPVSGGQQLTLDRPLRQAAINQVVDYYRICARSVASCRSFGAAGSWKERFRGHPNAPQVNYALPTQDPTPSGKKG